MMMIKRLQRNSDLPSTGNPATEQREAKSSAEEVLIEEILAAAGLEALD